jgi:hypothetical protein
MKRLRSCGSDERGVALVMTLLMVLAVSILTSGLVVVANSEALSSLSYTTMTQVRYGAESGIHAAANHLLHSYAPPSVASATDPIAAYDTTKSPVTFNGQPVVLSSDPAVPSNYPSSAAADAFAAASSGTLNVNNAPVAYRAQARLLSMKVLKEFSTNQDVTLQTWEIIGSGRVSGAGAAVVEVSTVIERQQVPVFSYAAFATHDGCDALSFAGGATTKSYDSRDPLSGGKPVVSDKDGNVGTNGNLDANGGPTEINGTLSTPRTGVGDCTANNVTAATISGFAKVQDGLVTLPQPIKFATPPDIDPLTGKVDFKSGCDNVPDCENASGVVTIKPTSTVKMGNVDLNSGIVLHLNAGIYEINSIKLNGNAKIVVDSGPVIIKVAGQGESTAIDLSGNGVTNPSLKPTDLQFFYGGTGNVKITGGTESAALVYAPNASASLAGGSDFYGSIVTKFVTDTGGVTLHYDRALKDSTMTAGNPTMATFSWRTF